MIHEEFAARTLVSLTSQALYAATTMAHSAVCSISSWTSSSSSSIPVVVSETASRIGASGMLWWWSTMSWWLHREQISDTATATATESSTPSSSSSSWFDSSTTATTTEFNYSRTIHTVVFILVLWVYFKTISVVWRSVAMVWNATMGVWKILGFVTSTVYGGWFRIIDNRNRNREWWWWRRRRGGGGDDIRNTGQLQTTTTQGRTTEETIVGNHSAEPTNTLDTNSSETPALMLHVAKSNNTIQPQWNSMCLPSQEQLFHQSQQQQRPVLPPPPFLWYYYNPVTQSMVPWLPPPPLRFATVPMGATTTAQGRHALSLQRPPHESFFVPISETPVETETESSTGYNNNNNNNNNIDVCDPGTDGSANARNHELPPVMVGSPCGAAAKCDDGERKNDGSARVAADGTSLASFKSNPRDGATKPGQPAADRSATAATATAAIPTTEAATFAAHEENNTAKRKSASPCLVADGRAAAPIEQRDQPPSKKQKLTKARANARVWAEESFGRSNNE